jgi:NADPH:quinone reductase-like Zn-dependent oxidoreductase
MGLSSAVSEGAMKAMVYHQYGSPDNLEMQEIETPAVEEDQVLVGIQAASVNALDWHFLTGKPFLARVMNGGLLKPKQRVLGVDLAGRVEAVGASVARFQPGDEVFGGCGNGGAFAEYGTAVEHQLQPKPANVTFEEAAAAGAAAHTALQCLRDGGQIQAGQHVLINGASGGVGTFAVQIAKAFGATVTGVCSTQNLDLVRSIGADQVIDYTKVDVTQGGQRYDLIFDVAARLSFADCKRVLNPQRIFVTTEFSPSLLLKGLWASLTGDQKLVSQLAKPPPGKDSALMRELLERGQVKPVIDRSYPLHEVPDALRYLGQGHARAKVVITMR